MFCFSKNLCYFSMNSMSYQIKMVRRTAIHRYFCVVSTGFNFKVNYVEFLGNFKTEKQQKTKISALHNYL